MTETLTIRHAQPEHGAEIAEILNEIIRIGGTTALKGPQTAASAAALTWENPHHLCTVVALDGAGRVAGFQWLDRDRDQPDRIGHIATFSRQTGKVPGAGRAMMAETVRTARAAGLSEIVALIRDVNAGGITFYGRMGFEDRDGMPGAPPEDGVPKGKVVKVLTL